MVKAFKAFRFDPVLYAEFKDLAARSGLMVTEAFEKFMEACVRTGAVTYPQVAERRVALEAEARVLLTWRKQGEYWYNAEDGEELSVKGRLFALLGQVADEELRREIEEELKKPEPKDAWETA